MKGEKIKKVLEEEKKLREFHANPVPNFSQPAIGSFSITNPINFQFKTDRRLEESHKREKPADDKEEKFVFKAKPALVLKKAPFEPKKGNHSALTVGTAFHLNAEERAKKERSSTARMTSE
ncbi:targeting protein for Xklp2-like [Nilaparvata lugens]|uniref:targeting protein for Xklp2-like n=1 Tax=Nilaparvata lugens TaxID=108931 RepID=UPI00193E1EC9|nr:targeting protein for Xklp2-like [Nilaparvata lugens]